MLQEFYTKLKKSSLPTELQDYVLQFCLSVDKVSHKDLTELFSSYLSFVENEYLNPTPFPYYHTQERSPVDFYQFGLEMIRPLIDFSSSHVLGIDQLKKIEELLQLGDNVILLANHQSEADPQIMSLLLENLSPKLGQEMIFVAGHRVVADPLAIPFSRGRNLLCIYSKRYLELSTDAKTEKLQHNSRTISALEELLSEGGKCIYVAPSGGRDRKDESGDIVVSPFDPSSTELFLLLGQRSKQKTHYVPFSMYTYPILPPPEGIRVELGEPRIGAFSPTGICFGPFIDPSAIPTTSDDKKEGRKDRADYIHQIVCTNYKKIVESCSK